MFLIFILLLVSFYAGWKMGAFHVTNAMKEDIDQMHRNYDHFIAEFDYHAGHK